jgi:hypothetical protein
MKQNGRGKPKGSANAHRESSPRKGKYLPTIDEEKLSRMLKDWTRKEEESEQGAIIDGVIESMIRRGLVAPNAYSRSAARSRDESDVTDDDADDDSATGSSNAQSKRKRKQQNKMHKLYDKIDTLTEELEIVRRRYTRLQDENAFIQTGVTNSITAALTPGKSGGTLDSGARTLTLEQLTAMFAQAKEAALQKTPDKPPTPKPSKAQVRKENMARLNKGLFQADSEAEEDEVDPEDNPQRVLVYLGTMLKEANDIKQLSEGEYTVSTKHAAMAQKLATAVAKHFATPATAKLLRQLCDTHKLLTKAGQPSSQLKVIFRAIVSRKLDLTPDQLCISTDKLM